MRTGNFPGVFSVFDYFEIRIGPNLRMAEIVSLRLASLIIK